ncbi:DUF1292 domain-containing protein [bacterium]|jgi:uncharacterized protein YrzB (UPF0473 family)|nr:DUF1292 domain-containing protein [bacterium]MBR1618668.1 DUF1292 domain-containing protein [bacterium]
MTEEENNLIELTDDEGNVIKCALYDIIEFEDKQYAILADMSHTEDEEYDTIIVTYKEEDGMSYFETIEDDDEFDRVSDYVDKILEEEYEDDEDEE